jgi:hypothetical protein
MMIAGAGMLPGASSLGASLGVSSSLTSSIGSFANLPITGQFSNIVSSASSLLGSSTLDSLRTLASSTFPALTNAIPSSFTSALSLIAPGGVANGGLTGLISTTASGIMGGGDLSKFTQVFNSSQGFLSQANQFINSNININSISDTFNKLTGGTDSLMTGNFSQISSSLGSFGSDLSKLGGLIDMKNLPNLGNPSELLSRISNLSGGEIPGLNQILGQSGISQSTLNSILSGQGGLDATAQKLLYTAMGQVTGPALTQVKNVLGISPALGNITTMTDLLDPKKILPNSFDKLTMPTVDGLQNVYKNASGSINTNIEKFLQDPNAPAYTGDDPIVRARLGLSPLPDKNSNEGILTA